MSDKNELEKKCIDTIRFLAADAIEKAKSGHPGMPLGAAPMAYVLWSRFLRHNPANPAWAGRDRDRPAARHSMSIFQPRPAWAGPPMIQSAGMNTSLPQLGPTWKGMPSRRDSPAR